MLQIRDTLLEKGQLDIVYMETEDSKTVYAKINSKANEKKDKSRRNYNKLSHLTEMYFTIILNHHLNIEAFKTLC